MTIGDKIKEARYVRGWTRRTLSHLTEFSEQSVINWETGVYKPSERAIRALEKAFNEKLRA